MKGTTIVNHTATTVAQGPHRSAVLQWLLERTDVPSESRRVQQDVNHHVRAGESNLNTEVVIRLLNEALGMAVISILRYKRRYFMTAEIRPRWVETMLLQHVADVQAYADQLAERIKQLGGQALLPFERLLNRSHAEQVEVNSLAEMIMADLFSEQGAIHNYRKLIASIGNDDQRTRQVLERILAQEEAHAESLAGLLRDRPSQSCCDDAIAPHGAQKEKL
ncbi:MAG: bacterioferritin [Nitrospira sp.]|nr:bacterioferritin [Nitrospira sp.]